MRIMWLETLKSTWDQMQQPATILICNIPLNSNESESKLNMSSATSEHGCNIDWLLYLAYTEILSRLTWLPQANQLCF